MKIHGVKLTPLNLFLDERGSVTEIYKKTPGEAAPVYAFTFSINPNVVKAWHFHKDHYDLWIPVTGLTKVVLYDNRKESDTKGVLNEYYLGPDSRYSLFIPKMVIHGAKAIGRDPSVLISFQNTIYTKDNPDQHRIYWRSEDIPYSWDCVFK